MTSLIYNKIIRPTPAATWLDSDGSLNVNWDEYDSICRTELMFLCKVLATVYGHSTTKERFCCIQYFRSYGINCIIRPVENGTIWKIKYENESHHFTHLWMRACRGTLISVQDWVTSNSNIVTVSLLNCPPIKFFPLDKFQEFYGKSAQEMLFPNNVYKSSVSYTAREKVDGSLITIYYNGTEITANTLDSFGEAPMKPGKLSYQERALSYLTDEAREFLINNEYYFVCELVTKDNQTVSRYNKEGLCLLYLCTRKHKIAPDYQTDHVFETLFSENPNWWRPHSYHIDSMEELNELTCRITELFPDVENPKGFVLYCENIPIANVETNVSDSNRREDDVNSNEEDVKGKEEEDGDDVSSKEEEEDGDDVKGKEEDVKGKEEEDGDDVSSKEEEEEEEDGIVEKEDVDVNSKDEEEDVKGKEKDEDGVNSKGKGEEKEEEEKDERKKMAACFDFDGTLVEVDVESMNRHKRKYRKNRHISMWDRKASFGYVEPYKEIWKLFTGYMCADIPTFVVSGRKYPVESKLQRYIDSELSPDLFYKLITIPGECIKYHDTEMERKILFPDSIIAKNLVYSILSGKYKCLVYEDDNKVLSNILSLGCVGINVIDGNLEYPGSTSTQIVGLCGLPGSGKTTILKEVYAKLRSNDIKVGYLSTEDSDLNVKLNSELRRGYKILLLDMCFTESANIKLLDKTCAQYTIFTHMPVKDNHVHENYPHWCLTNITNRDSNADFIHCRDIIIQKLTGIDKVLPNCVHLFPNLYTEIEEYLKMLCPIWKKKNVREASDDSLGYTIWPTPEFPLEYNEIWMPYPRITRDLKYAEKPLSIICPTLDIKELIPSVEYVSNVLVYKILSLLTIRYKRKRYGFYYGLAVSSKYMDVCNSLIGINTYGNKKPYVHHLTLNVENPLSKTKLGVTYILKSKHLYTNNKKSILALELENTNIIDHPHISLSWSDFPIECRLVLESGKSVVVNELKTEFPGYSLFLV